MGKVPPVQWAIMEVVGRAIRLYGSNDYYGEPRWSPEGQPFVSTDFGKPGDTAKVYIGAVPLEVREDVSDWTAIANAMLDSLTGQPPVADGISQLLQQRELLAFEDLECYITFLIDRPIDLPDDGRRDSELWYDPDRLEPFDTALRADADEAFDMLAVHLAPILNPTLFARKAMRGDRFIFKAENRVPLFYPRLTTSANVSVGKSKDSFPAADLEQRLASLSGRTSQSLSWLRRAMRWYASALTTGDRWRRFQALWLTLELLSHKLAERYRESVVLELAARPRGNTLDSSVVSRLTWDPSRMPLASKFAIAAIALNPEASAGDVAVFARIKKARDDLSHGEIVKEGELPLADAEALAARYVHLASAALLDS
jgi:hypothetical protein